MQGKYEAAFEGSTRATLANDLNTVGFAALSRGDLDIAEAYFRRALAINPVYDKTAASNLAWLEAERARLARLAKP
jgi:Tfp pilus assembly protein PilF